MSIVEEMRGFEIDHEPDGWPAVRMRQISSLCDEVERLRSFAQAVMECWPMGDLDGSTLQDTAEKYGLLRPETRHEPCGEGCSCAEYALPDEFSDGVTCYRKTPLLTGKTHNA